MIPFKLVHSGVNMSDGAMLLSLQDCMSASVNRSLTIILFNLLAVSFYLFLCYCLFNPCAAACVPYRLVLVQCSESDCQTCCNRWNPQCRCFQPCVELTAALHLSSSSYWPDDFMGQQMIIHGSLTCFCNGHSVLTLLCLSANEIQSLSRF